ncbi:MAG: hypothetical protein LBE48_02340 [Methanomassiliicoccaceae archaeon]|jgi:hypothetical protein|nr:hypothetical protein [Methanomassiliicoccaceae archaeon]
MSKLSLIPNGVVIAMQAALVILVLLAAVPIAMGGISADSEEGAKISYDNTKNTLAVGFDADVRTNLYFSVDGFSCNIYVESGDMCVISGGIGDITIPGSGSSRIFVNEEIPFIAVVMAMLYGSSFGDDETAVIIEVAGSTLGGMISLKADVRTVVAETSLTSLTMKGVSADTVNQLNASFTVQKNDLTEQMFGTARTMKTGDLTIAVTSKTGTSGYDVTVTMTAPAGRTIKGEIEMNIETEQAASLIKILETLHGRQVS